MKQIKCMGLIILLYSQMVLASNEWFPDQVYTAGNIVTYKGDTYISSHRTKGIEPIINDINWDGWVYVENSSVQNWQPNRAYDGNDLVQFNSSYYLAKWWSKDAVPSDSTAWRKLSDDNVEPLISHENPVLGSDIDNNGIRDDYEQAVTTMYPSDKQYYTNLALAASYVWKRQIEVALDDTIIMSPESAALTLNEELALDKCFTELKTEDEDFEYPHLAYYNTLERAHKYRVGHERIGKMIGDITDLIIPTEPCIGYKKQPTHMTKGVR